MTNESNWDIPKLRELANDIKRMIAEESNNWEKIFDKQFFPAHLMSEPIKSNLELKSFITLLIKEMIDEIPDRNFLTIDTPYGKEMINTSEFKQQLRTKYGIK